MPLTSASRRTSLIDRPVCRWMVSARLRTSSGILRKETGSRITASLLCCSRLQALFDPLSAGLCQHVSSNGIEYRCQLFRKKEKAVWTAFRTHQLLEVLCQEDGASTSEEKKALFLLEQMADMGQQSVGTSRNDIRGQGINACVMPSDGHTSLHQNLLGFGVG